MRVPLLRLIYSFRNSYWFVPSLMVLVAMLLAPLMVWLDTGPLGELLGNLSWYQQSKPEGAREVLSAIAASMITVAGVVFSITIVAIAYAASQYGPRVLTNFMSDRGNKVTLGTFIGTFVYSIAVLRTIQSGENAFVPQLAVFVALLLALCSIAVLIYFIHHVPESIDINSVTARIGRHLLRGIDDACPSSVADPPAHPPHREEELRHAAETTFASGAVAIPCRSEGYVQILDEEHLLAAACRGGIVLRVELAPGSFAFGNRPLAQAAPPERISPDLSREIAGAWSLGANRTPDQDLLFLIDELVEISARALSPGVNDPFTAITCMDWLAAAGAELARRRPPSAFRVDKEGALRIILPVCTFAQYIERGFGRVRPYAAKDATAAEHFLSRLPLVAAHCVSETQVDVLRGEARALLELVEHALDGPARRRIRTKAATVETELAARRSVLVPSLLAD